MTISNTINACEAWVEDVHSWSLPPSPYSYSSYLQLRAKGSQSPVSAESKHISQKKWSTCPGPEAAARLRRRAQTDPTYRAPSEFIFTPSTPPTVVPARSPSFIAKKSSSSPQLYHYQQQQLSCSRIFEPVYPSRQLLDMSSDSEGDASDETVYAARPPVKSSLNNGRIRTRLTSSKKSVEIPKIVTTLPTLNVLGETETEFEEQVIALPTSRKLPDSAPLIPPHRLEELTPYLFEISRFLSIVPAVVGAIYNSYQAYQYHSFSNSKASSLDFVVSALWAMLTGWQCLALTTGLLSRWQAYYRPLSTLIRLLALQAICWPATHFTLRLFDPLQRPLVCWAIIGSTTCFSRSVQMWVTSNLWDISRGKGTKLGSRRWDWSEVGVKCALPAGILYFLTAWVLIIKFEWSPDC